MPAFVDRARIFIRSGKGGDGHVSFRREKFVASGGPDGGDGGRGGDVIFQVDKGLSTLADFHYGGKYKAENGHDGDKRRRTGASGEDLVIKVPEGTVIREAAGGRVVADMSGECQRLVVLKGGRGGSGNMHYATSTMQAPRYAKPGGPAKELEVILELKVIADVGLVGFPNVGKSTFLSRVSNARPKIADYHFTTLTPMLGIVDLPDARGFCVADIPGLIEGAAEGVGLGHEFLRHIERTRLLVHVVDAAGSEGRDPLEDIEIINRELVSYGAGLESRPQLLAANKIDLLPEGADDEAVKRLRDYGETHGIEVYPISTMTGAGLNDLLYRISRELDALGDTPQIFEREYDPETELTAQEEDYTVTYDAAEEEYVVEGPRIDKMLGYTNLESERGFAFFQKFLADAGILDQLEAMGIQEGDTVRMYGHSFDYYRNAADAEDAPADGAEEE
ncbi:MAG: GTPase ObgE [Butyrivibrio sp.]|nr:GTPase ObgE [Butyrivibrio sp.]